MPSIETKSTETQLSDRQQLYDMFQSMYADEKINNHLFFQNLGLFMRNSALAKILFINELYQSIVDFPGIIMEFGCHIGQNLVLFESLRAIYEPFNIQRRIVGFDTFTHEGYASRDENMDGTSNEITKGGYKLPDTYPDLLRSILAYHEKTSVVPEHPRCEVVEGDVVKNVPLYIADHPGETVALGYFDLATYNPTKTCLEAIFERLIPGSVLMMDELNFRAYPGASTAFLDFSKKMGFKYKIRNSVYMRDRSIVTFML